MTMFDRFLQSFQEPTTVTRNGGKANGVTSQTHTWMAELMQLREEAMLLAVAPLLERLSGPLGERPTSPLP